MRALGKLFLLLFLIAATIAVWQIIRPGLVSSSRPAGNPYPPPNPPPQPGAQPPPSAGSPIVNLAILNVRGVQEHGARYVEVTVQNHGPAIASAAAGWCSYRCPSTGTAANNLPILQHSNLAPGQTYSEKFSFSPCPDPRLYVECLLQPGYGFQDPNFSDNRWSGTVATR